MLAALGPKNVALAAELFEAWEPIFYLPERAAAAFGEPLAEGAGRRDPELGPLDVVADTHLLVTEDADEAERALRRVRQHLALYVGGMGARGRNFYNDLAVRYGFPDAAREVQDAYLGGRPQEAAAALPEELVRGVSLVGPRGLRRRAGGRLPRGGGHHAQRHAAGRGPRDPARVAGRAAGARRLMTHRGRALGRSPPRRRRPRPRRPQRPPPPAGRRPP